MNAPFRDDAPALEAALARLVDSRAALEGELRGLAKTEPAHAWPIARRLVFLLALVVLALFTQSFARGATLFAIRGERARAIGKQNAELSAAILVRDVCRSKLAADEDGPR